ncbi:MAG: phosphoribosylanthranilate isomerase [Proteobacteria bacterium]|nr:phosphoribosylanthranilate isomerase [Pseudomonadota bacterium]
MNTLVKICGITNYADASLAAEMGADAIGFVFYKGSKRFIPHEEARKIICKLPPFLIRCGVFVDERWEKVMEVRNYCGLDRVQVYAGDRGLCGNFAPGITIMAFRVRDKKDVEEARKSESFPLLDSYHENMHGGGGVKFNWDLLADFGRPFMLAGGINSENIDMALKLNPYAIDIASGVESEPGKKDPDKMAEIFKRIGAHRLNRSSRLGERVQTVQAA